MTRIENTSQAQRGLYILHCVDPQSSTYNVNCSFQLNGEIDRAAMESSVDRLVQRHESLRTVFRLDDNQLVQIIYPESAIRKTAELRNGYVATHMFSAKLSDTQRKNLINEEINKPFDLHQAPLFRFTLFSENSIQEHLFVITIHHTVFDHFSKSLLLNELGELYNNFAHNTPDNTEPRITQFSDYLQYRDKKIEKYDTARALKFWKKKLHEVEPLDLPLDRLRPALPSGQGVRIEHDIPAELVAAMREYAKSQQVTFFMVTLALWKVLLALWSGKQDISVGTHIADRSYPGTDKTIGFLLNTLVLRTSLDKENTFADFVKSVQKTCFNTFRYADTPFETLVSEFQADRNYQRNPFFDVRFSHLQNSQSPLKLKGLAVEPIDLVDCRARYDLTLTIRESGTRCFAQLEYRSTLFNSDTMQWLLNKYIDLSHHLINDPQTRLDQYPIVDGALLDKCLYQFNDTVQPYPHQNSVVDLIEKQCINKPEAVALYCDGVSVIYQDLHKRSGQLANHLQMQGVGSGTLVAISLERSLDMVVAALAVLRAGATYLPVDHHYPDSRIEHMIRDSGCEFMIAHSWLKSDLPVANTTVCWLDKEQEHITTLSDTPKAIDIEPSSLAYIIYTSGSTGTPKGVQVTHRNVVNFLCSMKNEPGMTSNDKLVAVTTLSFDIAVLEIWLPLICGATSIIANTAQTTDGKQLLRLIVDQQATVMQATPATWRLLINDGWTGSAQFKSLCGGEAMPSDLAKELLQRCGEVWNMYGPTETTVWSSIYKVTDSATPILIGKPIANTTMHILDWRKKPCYPGVAGELFIGGDGVTAGYLGRDELTAERYVAVPFLDNKILYATGDAARFATDGNIDCIGRLDNQVKVRGHRVELGEIESKLNEHKAVRQAIATTIAVDSNDIRIVAAVELQEPVSLDNAQWRAWLAKRIPEYMVPQVITVLDELPLTPNGKLDRNALATMDLMSSMSLENPASPQTQLERSMANIWSELLGLRSVPVNQVFFNLGGHSLLAMQMIARVNDEMNIAIDPVVMASASIRELLSSHDNEVDSIKSIAQNQSDYAVDTFFFNKEELYARLHRPANGQAVQGAVLLCNPIFVEANNILWGYQRLATLLAERGYYAMRFDYFGCGNSMGEDEQGDAVRWQNDVSAAAKKLLDISGQENISVLGFRYGATLSANLESVEVDKLVLWEPVSSSNEHVKLFDHRYHSTITYLNVIHRAFVPKKQNEITGFPLSTPLRHSLCELDLFDGPLIRKAAEVHLVTNDLSLISQSGFSTIDANAKAFSTHVVNDTVQLIDQHDDSGTWLPGKSINTVVDCIVGAQQNA